VKVSTHMGFEGSIMTMAASPVLIILGFSSTTCRCQAHFTRQGFGFRVSGDHQEMLLRRLPVAGARYADDTRDALRMLALQEHEDPHPRPTPEHTLPERRSILVMISANLTAMWAVWQSSTGAYPLWISPGWLSTMTCASKFSQPWAGSFLASLHT